MTKIKHCIFLLVLMIIPVNIYAYELTCDRASVNYDENFFCYLTGTNNQTYSELSGNISSSNGIIECNPTSFSNGLSIIESEKKFAYMGNPAEERLVTFSCKLIKQLSNVEKAQIRIDNFKYELAGNGLSSDNEILSTDFISANIYDDNTEIDNLPRNTSNPDSLLKEISEENLNIVFSRFVTIYNQEVLYEVESLNVNAVANNPSSVVKIEVNGIENNKSLNVGKNVVNIFVTSPDGVSTTCYTLNVTRLARGESIYYPEKDATLYSLIIPGYAISFDKDTYEYHVHLTSDVSKLTVNAVPTYDEATVDISPSNNLRNGSIIKVTVTSKDKSNTLEYSIKIAKDAPKVNYIPYIIMGVVGIALIAMIVLFIKTSKTKKSGGPTVIPDIDLNNNVSQNPNTETSNQNQVINNPQPIENNNMITNNVPMSNDPQMVNNQVAPSKPVDMQMNQGMLQNQVDNTNNMVNQNFIQSNNIQENNLTNENNQ